MPNRRKIAVYTAPMALFIALLALNSLLEKIDHTPWFSASKYWLYPLQTVLCGSLVLWFRREYDWSSPRRTGFAVLVAVIVFLAWISPQTFFGFAPRTVGFDPLSYFGNEAFLYWATIIFRFVRLVVVVPLIEEIFWRGFLLRYLIAEDFDRVSFGAFSWFSFLAVTVLFTFSHSKADWPAALLTGVLYNLVAYRTKSLTSCVLAHAVTNLLLGLWIMKTQQWGFW
jgi:CAAX prenyl protease-like protein